MSGLLLYPSRECGLILFLFLKWSFCVNGADLSPPASADSVWGYNHGLEAEVLLNSGQDCGLHREVPPKRALQSLWFPAQLLYQQSIWMVLFRGRQQHSCCFSHQFGWFYLEEGTSTWWSTKSEKAKHYVDSSTVLCFYEPFPSQCSLRLKFH